MHATKFASIGIKYLGDLQLNDLCELQDELNSLWNNGQSKISNNLFDKVVDTINYEITQLKSDPYNFASKKNDAQLKKLVDYLTLVHSQGRALVENSVWDILNQELTVQNLINLNSTLTYPLNWTAMSTNIPVEFVSLNRSLQEFEDISDFFSKSLQKIISSYLFNYSNTKFSTLAHSSRITKNNS